jgi:ketosteroid isomerase-like protein
MSQENLGVVRRAFEAFNRGGPEGTLPFLDPHVEWHDVPDQPEATVHYGHEGFRQAFEVFLESIDEFEVVPEELRDLGDEVLVVQRTTGRGRGSGAEFTQRIWGLWAVRSGQITRVQFYRDRAEALRAAGLTE